MGIAAGVLGKAGAVFAAVWLIASGAAQAQCVDPMRLAPEYGVFAFTQTRHLNGVRAPLVSRGRAQVAEGRVDWRVTQPLDIHTVITAAGVTQSVEGGPPQRMGGGGDAFLSSAGLLNLLAGDIASLSSHYDVARTTGPDGGWRVRLTPKSPSMARFLSHIEAAGCARVSNVEVRQANGDWMEIALSPPER
jgi:hypothetical protein